MLEPALTLNKRIVILLVASAFVFSIVFALVEVNNQINNINRYTVYHANLSSILIKNTLENILASSQNNKEKLLQRLLDNLYNTNLIQSGVIFDEEGNIIAKSGIFDIDRSLTFREIARFQDLKNLLQAQENRWFLSELDKNNQQLYIYIAINNPLKKQLQYICKATFSLTTVEEAIGGVYKPIIVIIVMIIILNILLGYILSRTIVGPIKVLNKTTKIIADGDLSVRTRINTGDELQELGETFNLMAEELQKMKERAENANPLTKLPGNIVIQEAITKAIQENKKFTVIYCDLDNFKAFNDKYGIAQGDEAIKLTAEVLKEAVKQKGNPQDFIGHEGGDDFIILTTPQKTEDIANYVIKEFDKRIISLYSEEDRKLGYIMSTGRDGQIKKFPIMTISLAGVTNLQREITSYAQVTNIAAEVKKKAKQLSISNFVLDKRAD